MLGEAVIEMVGLGVMEVDELSDGEAVKLGLAVALIDGEYDT
jgi:ABC-type multidrug transport system ATPase subunit